MNGNIINDGYTILIDSSKEKPINFKKPSINIKVTNLGLSTAFLINTYIYRLESIEGIADLEDIAKETILDFYERINICNYNYYEDEKMKTEDWIITPTYNLCNRDDEFNIVLDLSEVKKKYYSIIEFRFQDIYENKYKQLFYISFDSRFAAFLPASHVIKL